MDIFVTEQIFHVIRMKTQRASLRIKLNKIIIRACTLPSPVHIMVLAIVWTLVRLAELV